LTFKVLIILISQGLVKAIQRELNHFFGALQGETYDIHEVTKGALTQARAKLKPEAFIELYQAALPGFYEGAAYNKWKGHRLLAIDGSIINLPSHPSVEEEFGAHQVGCKADVQRSMGTVSLCYDVLNLVTLDARLDKFTTSEPALLQTHLKQVNFLEQDLLLLDRGYPSTALMYELNQKTIDFCMRLRMNWKDAKIMCDTGQTDKEIVYRLPTKNRNLLKKYNSTSDSVRVRLVVVELDNGELEILCTSLLDKVQYPHSCFKELYHHRWVAEEGYKLLKCRVELEVFSGKTAHAVKQDFYAKVFMMVMCAILSFPIAEQIKKESESKQRKHNHQINRTNALGFLRQCWITLWLHEKTELLLQALSKALKNSTDIIRPGRSFERKHRSKKPPSMTYKHL
jgi:hypothetical protein